MAFAFTIGRHLGSLWLHHPSLASLLWAISSHGSLNTSPLTCSYRRRSRFMMCSMSPSKRSVRVLRQHQWSQWCPCSMVVWFRRPMCAPVSTAASGSSWSIGRVALQPMQHGSLWLISRTATRSFSLRTRFFLGEEGSVVNSFVGYQYWRCPKQQASQSREAILAACRSRWW